MNKFTVILLALAIMAGSAFADIYRVNYTTRRGQGHRITVQADSMSEARRTVEQMFPGSYVTNAFRVRK